MKKLFLTLLCLCIITICNAQDEFKFSEVIKTDSVSSGMLIEKAKSWLITHQFANLDTTTVGQLRGENWYKVYQKGVVSKQLHGTITYKVLLEVKDFRYRYSFTNFVFHYHKQDRNLKMVPTGKVKPLEDKKADGWQKTWEKHKAYTKKQMEILIADLKNAMLEPKKAEIKKEEDF